MSTSAQDAAFSLTLGGSRLGDIPWEIRHALVVAGANPLLKQEEKTLVWQLQLALPERVESGVVKLYRRQGMWIRFRGQALPLRVRREFNALCVLADGGVPCSLPLAWGWGVAPEHGRFELLVTREIPGAVSLKACLTRGERLRSEDVMALFDSLRRMHERGVYHGALWPKNVLLAPTREGGRQFHVIDMARALRFRSSICGTSMARHDLLPLLYSLAGADGAPESEAMLRRYGCGTAEAQRIAAQARRYRSSRHQRNRLALTFQLRALWARAN